MIVKTSHPGSPNDPDKTRMKMSESEFNAEIEAAEERGRASAAVQPTGSVTVAVVNPVASAIPVTPIAAAAPNGAPEPTPEQKAAMEELAAMRAADATADDPKILAADITAQVAKAKSEGRTIGFAQAAAELRAETHGGEAEKIARQLTAQVAKAKSEGRRIGLAQAQAELRKEGLI